MSRREGLEFVAVTASAKKSMNCGRRIAASKLRWEFVGRGCSCARNILRSRIAGANWFARVFGLLKTRESGSEMVVIVFRSKASYTASVLLRGSSSTTNRTIPRNTSSLTDFSRNGETPMTKVDAGCGLVPDSVPPQLELEKLNQHRLQATTSVARLSFLPLIRAAGVRMVMFMGVRSFNAFQLIA